jgi:hypothetical protein
MYRGKVCKTYTYFDLCDGMLNNGADVSTPFPPLLLGSVLARLFHLQRNVPLIMPTPYPITTISGVLRHCFTFHIMSPKLSTNVSHTRCRIFLTSLVFSFEYCYGTLEAVGQKDKCDKSWDNAGGVSSSVIFFLNWNKCPRLDI